MASERKKRSARDERPPQRRRLIVVAGKGGVGRSTVAAGLAAAAAERGERVLAIDGPSDGGLQRALGPKRRPGIDVIELNTEDALGEYLDTHLAIPIPGLRLGPIAHAFDFLAVAAPGVREILAMGKVCNEVRKGTYDLVVLDAPATGHVVELLAAPDTLYEMVPVGPITKQTAWMRDLLAEESSSAVIVTLAEDLPVTETLSLNERITTESSVRVQAVVANRLPAELGAPALAEAARLAKKDGPIGVAAQMILDRRRRADEALEPLFESISVPILSVSECDNESRLVHHVALTVEDLL